MPGPYTAHHPPLIRKPGRQNWVEKAGKLPPTIDAIARALVAKGKTESHAIAIAVSSVKKTCASGTAFDGKATVSPAARAKACAAVTQWEALKATSKARTAAKRRVPSKAKAKR